jgi:hypothetical protein
MCYGGGQRKHQSVTVDELKALIEATRERGLTNDRQGRLFTEVVTFDLLRVRHVTLTVERMQRHRAASVIMKDLAEELPGELAVW